MSNTTKAQILLIAPELNNLTDPSDLIWNQILEDVAGDVGSTAFGTLQEKAQRYKAAHHLSLILETQTGGSSSGTGSLTMDKNGDVLKQYSSPIKANKAMSPYERTTYGKEYLSIRNRCVVGFRGIVPGC